VTVRMKRESETVYRVEFTDTGVGIPEKDLNAIFNRFDRGKGAQVKRFKGTGIGLSLVKDIIKLHGGEITVASELGIGSTFTVFVPLVANVALAQGES